MAFNFFEIMSKYRQFENMLKQSGKDPQQMLEEEIKKRGISDNQLKEMIQQAQYFQKLLGLK